MTFGACESGIDFSVYWLHDFANVAWYLLAVVPSFVVEMMLTL